MRLGNMNFARYDYANFLTFGTYAAVSVIIPVALVSVARTLDFPLNSGGMGAGGALQLARSIPMVAAMLLCGFIGARFGKIRSVGVSLLLMALGIIMCAVAPSYWVLFAAMLVAGCGEGTIEGLATPLIQDLHEKEPGRYINFTHGFWSVGVLCTVLISGYLLQKGVSWRILTLICGMAALIPGLMMLLPDRHRPVFATDNISSAQVVQNAMACVKNRRFWLFFAAMFAAGGGEYCLTFWSASFIQLSCGGTVWDGGIATACFAGGMVIGRTGGGLLVPQKYLRHFVVYGAVVATLLGISLAYVETLSGLFVLFFFTGIATGPFWPSVQGYSVDRLPGLDMTMIFILLSCAGVPGCGFFTWLMGVLGDQFGLRYSFLLVPGCFAAVALLIGIDWFRSLREKGGG